MKSGHTNMVNQHPHAKKSQGGRPHLSMVGTIPRQPSSARVLIVAIVAHVASPHKQARLSPLVCELALRLGKIMQTVPFRFRSRLLRTTEKKSLHVLPCDQEVKDGANEIAPILHSSPRTSHSVGLLLGSSLYPNSSPSQTRIVQVIQSKGLGFGYRLFFLFVDFSKGSPHQKKVGQGALLGDLVVS